MVRSLMFTALTCLTGKKTTKKKHLLTHSWIYFFFYVQGTDIIMDRSTVGSRSNWSKMIYRAFWKLLFESLDQNLWYWTNKLSSHPQPTELEPGATNSHNMLRNVTVDSLTHVWTNRWWFLLRLRQCTWEPLLYNRMGCECPWIP